MSAKEKRKKPRLSLISSMHYLKLVGRSALFLLATVMYILSYRDDTLFGGYEDSLWVLLAIGMCYFVEMVSRFFPSRLESMGCQKQFRKNYRPTGRTEPILPTGRQVAWVIVFWVALNGLIGLMYFTHVIDAGILVLISLAYGVCDMICILFFCPFQTWFLKNRCCTVCRIYNWDFAMMFTPFLFIPNPFTWTMLALSMALLIRWEITLHRHGERFSDATNACLSCANCAEKLCHHKTQLHKFWQKNKARLPFR